MENERMRAEDFHYVTSELPKIPGQYLCVVNVWIHELLCNKREYRIVGWADGWLVDQDRCNVLMWRCLGDPDRMYSMYDNVDGLIEIVMGMKEEIGEFKLEMYYDDKEKEGNRYVARVRFPDGDEEMTKRESFYMAVQEAFCLLSARRYAKKYFDDGKE